MAFRTTKYDGKTIPVKKFLKCFDESVTFIALTDPESESDGDYKTGANTNIVFTTPENFLLAVNHAKIPNTTYRKIHGFTPKSEIQVTAHLYRANIIHLKDPTPFPEAPFLNDPKFFRYIVYDHRGASYLIKNQVPIPEAFMKYLLSKDETLIPLIPSPSPELISALITENPHRVRFFPDDPTYQEIAVTKEPYTIQYFKSTPAPPDLVMKALTINGTAIRFVEDPSSVQCEAAVTQTYMAIQYIPKSKHTKALLTLTQSLLEADKETNIDFASLVK